MIKVNLVPREILDKEVQRQRAMQAGLVGVVILAIFAGISFQHYNKKVTLEKRYEEQKAKLKKLEAIVAQVNQFEARAAAVRSRLAVMNDLLKSRELYPKFMVDLIESFPDGVWIGPLSTAKGEDGLNISMPAFATSTRDVTTWLRTLEDSEVFSKAVISAITIDPLTSKHSFSMTMAYVPAGAEKEKKE